MANRTQIGIYSVKRDSTLSGLQSSKATFECMKRADFNPGIAGWHSKCTDINFGSMLPEYSRNYSIYWSASQGKNWSKPVLEIIPNKDIDESI